jgi:hypothetical protein
MISSFSSIADMTNEEPPQEAPEEPPKAEIAQAPLEEAVAEEVAKVEEGPTATTSQLQINEGGSYEDPVVESGDRWILRTGCMYQRNNSVF